MTVYYLADNPSYSAPDPAGKKKNALLGLAFVGLWNLLLMAFCVGFGLQNRRRSM